MTLTPKPSMPNKQSAISSQLQIIKLWTLKQDARTSSYLAGNIRGSASLLLAVISIITPPCSGGYFILFLYQPPLSACMRAMAITARLRRDPFVGGEIADTTPPHVRAVCSSSSTTGSIRGLGGRGVRDVVATWPDGNGPLTPASGRHARVLSLPASINAIGQSVPSLTKYKQKCPDKQDSFDLFPSWTRHR